jgi:ankyrin repeat protein
MKAKYCTRECQVGHWKTHRPICKQAASEAKKKHFTEQQIEDFLRACGRGDLQQVKKWLGLGIDVNVKWGEHGFFALFDACANGHLNVVKLLLEQGADVNAKNNSGSSSLIMACQHGHLHIVKLLLEQGADINALGFDSQTALGAACLNARLDIVRFLIARGADVNLGFPPIVLACGSLGEKSQKDVDMVGYWSRKYEVVQELLKN